MDIAIQGSLRLTILRERFHPEAQACALGALGTPPSALPLVRNYWSEAVEHIRLESSVACLQSLLGFLRRRVQVAFVCRVISPGFSEIREKLGCATRLFAERRTTVLYVSNC